MCGMRAAVNAMKKSRCYCREPASKERRMQSVRHRERRVVSRDPGGGGGKALRE